MKKSRFAEEQITFVLRPAVPDDAEAEARRQGFAGIYLYTHEKMTENQALYSKIGVRRV